jgi:uncharacterized DUF497 family protein
MQSAVEVMLRMFARHFEFEWDPAKAAKNLHGHGVDFDEAETVFLDPYAFIADDPDHSSDEQREIILGYSEQNRLLLVFLHRAWQPHSHY